MATIQSKIPFKVRKKRFNTATNCKLNTGKENTDQANQSPAKNNCANYEKLSFVPHLNENNTENGSGIEPIESTEEENESDVRTPSRRVRRLYSIDNEDEYADGGNSTSSPSKRSKAESTNCTSSAKNGVSSPHTPSQLITRLHLNTPPNTTVPNKTEEDKHLPPKRLFAGSTYQKVRHALQGSSPTSMPCREEQLDQLHTFLQKHLLATTSGTLYISGPPGTGKTACVSKTMDVPQYKSGYKMIYINCTSLKSSGSIYARIVEELGLKVSKRTEKEYLLNIEKYLASSHKMILLVLDEIDQLDSRKQSVLYTVFEWPSKQNSKLVLVGIANALDLTDRILPRLQARLDLKPVLLHFPPYTKMQIVNILTERLKQSGVSDMFPPSALQLLAGKVASTCGDIRRALDISRRVVELAEAQKSDPIMPLQPVDHTANTLSPRKSPRKNPDSAASVALKEVMAVLNSVYGASQTLVTDCDESFPLQQKVLISTLLLMLKKGRNRDITVGKLHEVYRRVCNKKNLLAVDQAEFLNLCQLVETRGIVKVQGRKEARLSKVSLQWDEEEVCAALRDKQLLSSILNDTSCL